MNTQSEKISVLEKVGYSLGDFAANLIFQTLMTFLAYFYTDVFKIPGSTASLIIFLGGMVGAFFTPVMGIIADRTNTRWGKFRPWILDRKSTRLNSSHVRISYAVFCLKKKST